jgi:hypothetical protein
LNNLATALICFISIKLGFRTLKVADEQEYLNFHVLCLPRLDKKVISECRVPGARKYPKKGAKITVIFVEIWLIL